MKLSNKIIPSGVELLKLLKKEVMRGQSPSPTYVLATKSAEVMTEKSSVNELKKGVAINKACAMFTTFTV